MPTTLFTWDLVVEYSVAQDYLESQPCYSADYQLVISYLCFVDMNLKRNKNMETVFEV